MYLKEINFIKYKDIDTLTKHNGTKKKIHYIFEKNT